MASWYSVTDFLDDATKLPSKVLLDIPNAGHLEGGTDKDCDLDATSVAGRDLARAPLLAREQAIRARHHRPHPPSSVLAHGPQRLVCFARVCALAESRRGRWRVLCRRNALAEPHRRPDPLHHPRPLLQDSSGPDHGPEPAFARGSRWRGRGVRVCTGAGLVGEGVVHSRRDLCKANEDLVRHQGEEAVAVLPFLTLPILSHEHSLSRIALLFVVTPLATHSLPQSSLPPLRARGSSLQPQPPHLFLDPTIPPLHFLRLARAALGVPRSEAGFEDWRGDERVVDGLREGIVVLGRGRGGYFVFSSIQTRLYSPITTEGSPLPSVLHRSCC
ncbi:hypothetical protein BJY59DRAFT_180769 [Rhodotorula toruloides]